MATTLRKLVPHVGVLCRTGAVAVMAGIWRARSIHEINAWLSARPLGQQVAVTLGVMAVILALSLVAAQFGWIGMLAFWLALIVLVN